MHKALLCHCEERQRRGNLLNVPLVTQGDCRVSAHEEQMVDA